LKLQLWLHDHLLNQAEICAISRKHEEINHIRSKDSSDETCKEALPSEDKKLEIFKRKVEQDDSKMKLLLDKEKLTHYDQVITNLKSLGRDEEAKEYLVAQTEFLMASLPPLKKARMDS